MSANRAPMTSTALEGGRVRVSKPRRPVRATVEVSPPPLPSVPPLPTDPALLAEIRSGIERGLAEAQAGIGYDLDEVLADMDRKIVAHRR